MTAPAVLSRPSLAGGQTITIPGVYQALRRYFLSWDEHGPQGSSLLYHGGSPVDGSPVSVMAVTLQGADHRIVAGYLKLAAQSQSDEEKTIAAGRRARRDRIRALRSI